MKTKRVLIEYRWLAYDPGDKVTTKEEIDSLEFGKVYTVAKYEDPARFDQGDPGTLQLVGFLGSWYADLFILAEENKHEDK